MDSNANAALENLRIIRSLMEKAHIYRAISAPAALLGGLIALGLGFRQLPNADQQVMQPITFLTSWLLVLAANTVLNVSLLSKEAQKRHQPLVSDGMKTALRALLPPMLVGGLMGAGIMLQQGSLSLGVALWICTYGLGLLATRAFSPHSILVLGWMFVVGGLAFFSYWAAELPRPFSAQDLHAASLGMSLSFGLLHLFYGCAVMLQKKTQPLVLEE
jgi:hypothetical protein